MKKQNEFLSDSEGNLLQENSPYYNVDCDKFLVVKEISGCKIRVVYEDGAEVKFSYTPEGINHILLRPAKLKELESKANFFNDQITWLRQNTLKTARNPKKSKYSAAQTRVSEFEAQEKEKSVESLVRTLSGMRD